MAVDVILWFILAVALGLLYCGCINTAPGSKPAKPRHNAPERSFDRAA